MSEQPVEKFLDRSSLNVITLKYLSRSIVYDKSTVIENKRDLRIYPRRFLLCRDKRTCGRIRKQHALLGQIINDFICVIRSDFANLKDLISTEKEHKSSVATSVDKADEDVAKKFDKLVLLLKGLFSYMENIGLKLDRDNGYFETEIYRGRLLCYDWGKIYRSRSDRRDY